ncbi:MAG: hypothetical protein AVDCRST_MAG10-1310 [uncultured Acidimicrobiales bacterium]|uniref:Uncharacterized protein n=1 Tax=uncultured Acidimicrobiales bacterium TaxID=310071 RepID=A0A6J4HUD1_9ACTN|nr:MAG: hypothetical protein AVDCRST_MAG10-1310 [uncultured Acidimicrobiales bacterium]
MHGGLTAGRLNIPTPPTADAGQGGRRGHRAGHLPRRAHHAGVGPTGRTFRRPASHGTAVRGERDAFSIDGTGHRRPSRDHSKAGSSYDCRLRTVDASASKLASSLPLITFAALIG